MEARKNSSERLERALSYYDLKALPKETQQKLEETMARSDFDPDKLADALEREQVKVDSEHNVSSEERCPWYVALTRFIVLFGIVGAFFAFFCTILVIGFRLFDKVCDLNISGWFITMPQSHPVIFFSVLIVGFMVFFFWFVNQLVKNLTESWKQE